MWCGIETRILEAVQERLAFRSGASVRNLLMELKQELKQEMIHFGEIEVGFKVVNHVSGL